MKLISFFRGDKVNYKENYEIIKKRLLNVASERDNYLSNLNNLKFEYENIKNKYEKLETKYKEFKKTNKLLIKEVEQKNNDLSNAINIIENLNKELAKEKKKPKKSVKNYNIKSERSILICNIILK